MIIFKNNKKLDVFGYKIVRGDLIPLEESFLVNFNSIDPWIKTPLESLIDVYEFTKKLNHDLFDVSSSEDTTLKRIKFNDDIYQFSGFGWYLNFYKDYETLSNRFNHFNKNLEFESANELFRMKILQVRGLKIISDELHLSGKGNSEG